MAKHIEIAGLLLTLDLAGTAMFAASGMLRDPVCPRDPYRTPQDLYALAALAGAGVVVAGQLLNLPPTAATIAGAALGFGVRLVAIRRGRALPTADRIS